MLPTQLAYCHPYCVSHLCCVSPPGSLACPHSQELSDRDAHVIHFLDYRSRKGECEPWCHLQTFPSMHGVPIPATLPLVKASDLATPNLQGREGAALRCLVIRKQPSTGQTRTVKHSCPFGYCGGRQTPDLPFQQQRERHAIWKSREGSFIVLISIYISYERDSTIHWSLAKRIRTACRRTP